MERDSLSFFMCDRLFQTQSHVCSSLLADGFLCVMSQQSHVWFFLPAFCQPGHLCSPSSFALATSKASAHLRHWRRVDHWVRHGQHASAMCWRQMQSDLNWQLLNAAVLWFVSWKPLVQSIASSSVFQIGCSVMPGR